MISDTIYFIYKVESQLDKDFLSFYIDNSIQGEWSGIGAGWNEAKFYLPEGMHTLKWVYEKDGSGFAGNDCAWLDNIIFPPLMTLTCYAGPDDYTCIGSDYQCDGQATDWVSVEWTTSGDGSFDNTSILNPIYNPGTNDIATGMVSLTITVEDTDGSFVNDEMALSIMDAPEAPDMPFGPDFVNLYYTTTSEYTTDPVPFVSLYEWMVTPIDAGSISGTGTTGTIIWNQSYLGTATITVWGINDCGEGIYSEGFDVTVDNFTSVSELQEEQKLTIYPNPNSGEFSIQLKGQEYGNLEVSIYNISGTLVYRQENIDGKNGFTGMINMSTYPQGMYFVKVSHKEGLFVKKVLLNK